VGRLEFINCADHAQPFIVGHVLGGHGVQEEFTVEPSLLFVPFVGDSAQGVV
jgi:hypothetical protein